MVQYSNGIWISDQNPEQTYIGMPNPIKFIGCSISGVSYKDSHFRAFLLRANKDWRGINFCPDYLLTYQPLNQVGKLRTWWTLKQQNVNCHFPSSCSLITIWIPNTWNLNINFSDTFYVQFSNGLITWLGRPFKIRHVWPLTRHFCPVFRPPFNNRSHLVHSNNRLVPVLRRLL